MALENAYYPHAIILPTGPVGLVQLQDLGVRTNDQDMTVFCGSGSAPEYIGIASSNPDITATITEIERFLTFMLANYDTEDPAPVVADQSNDNVDLLYRAGKKMGMREALSTTPDINVIGRVTSAAMIYWTTLTVSQDQPATLSLSVATAWNEVTDPLIFFISDLSQDCDVDELFTLGPVKVNGVTLSGVTSLTWSNNCQLETISSDGDPFPAYQSVRTISPEVTITTKGQAQATRTISQFSDTVNRGKALTALEVNLRKCRRDGIHEDDALGAHIKLTATSGLVRARGVSGSPTDTELSVRLEKPAGAIFEIAVQQTIT